MDKIPDEMPHPEKPTLALKPDEAARYLGTIQQGICLALLLVASAQHGARIAAKEADPERDGADPERDAESMRDHLKTIAHMLHQAGMILNKNGSEMTQQLEGMSHAFEQIRVALPPVPPDPAKMIDALEDGPALKKACVEWMDTPNHLSAAILCTKDHEGARDLADRHGIDLDASPDGIAAAFPIPKKGKPAKPAKPADDPSKAKPQPPTWTGRNGSKWNPDGTRGPDAPNN